MTTRPLMTTIIVTDYDEAIDYFTKSLGLELLEDTSLSLKKRWVRVGRGTAQFLLAQASTAKQNAVLGK